MDSVKENVETGEMSMDLGKPSAQEDGLANKASEGVEAVKSDGIKTEESKTESSTKPSSNGKLGSQLENVVRNTSYEQLSLPVDGVAETHLSDTLSNIDVHCEVPGEVLMEQHHEIVENLHGGVIATESCCPGLELPQHHGSDVVGNFSEEIMKAVPEGAESHSLEQLGFPIEENDVVKEKTLSEDENMPNMENKGLAIDNETKEKLILQPNDEKTSCVKDSGPSECDEEKEVNLTPYDEKHSSLDKSDLPFHGEDEEELMPLHEVERKLSTEDSVLPNVGDAINSNSDNLEHEPSNKPEKKNAMQLTDNEQNGSSKPRGKGRNSNTKSTRVLRGSPRNLRSRSQEKPKIPEPAVTVADKSNDRERTIKVRKKKKAKNVPVNEFTRARSHLRYLINRMGYEQNLIDAYAGEGWKGQSIEKVKLEKEVQRAKTEIVRTKLKTRDLFKCLDTSIAVGKLPESLFDSEGEIDSEDIFCAKCGSKDLRVNNDIILCDGACERAFHQLCLDPPLLKEDIPPDDKGWLCPGCDCKVDCIDLLNNSQGTNLSVLDSWEKVFPEVAASGTKLDDLSDYPSDDSEDNDYNPDDLDVDIEMRGEGESSSDESDFYSASDGTGDSPDKRQELLNLSSDDSEDDNYNPDAPDLDQQIKSESSSSDFSSDSEDLGCILENNKHEEEPVSILSDHTKSNRKGSLNGELKSLMEESNLGQGDISLSSGKRHVERLDYKKLQDDTYGNVSSDSSDEDWMDAVDVDDSTKRKKNNSTKRDSPPSTSGRTSAREVAKSEGLKQKKGKCAQTTPKRGTPRQKSDFESKNGLHESSANSSEQVSSAKKSDSRRLGETATQGLLKSFNENQYPERTVKEILATELGLTFNQVNKWFSNARWSFRHGPQMEALAAETAREKVAKTGSPATKQESGRKKSPTATATAAAPSSSRNRKRKVDASIENETEQVPAVVKSPEKKGVRRGKRKVDSSIENKTEQVPAVVKSPEKKGGGRGKRKVDSSVGTEAEQVLAVVKSPEMKGRRGKRKADSSMEKEVEPVPAPVKSPVKKGRIGRSKK